MKRVELDRIHFQFSAEMDEIQNKVDFNHLQQVLSATILPSLKSDLTLPHILNISFISDYVLGTASERKDRALYALLPTRNNNFLKIRIIAVEITMRYHFANTTNETTFANYYLCVPNWGLESIHLRKL